MSCSKCGFPDVSSLGCEQCGHGHKRVSRKPLWVNENKYEGKPSPVERSWAPDKEVERLQCGADNLEAAHARKPIWNTRAEVQAVIDPHLALEQIPERVRIIETLSRIRDLMQR